MTTSIPLRMVDGRSSIYRVYLCLVVFAVVCIAVHFFAVMRIDVCNGQFTLMNDRTTRGVALIGYMRSNPWFPCLYAVLTFGGVLFMQLRKCPEWAWWLWSVLLCSPFVLYASVCAYIGNKFIF